MWKEDISVVWNVDYLVWVPLKPLFNQYNFYLFVNSKILPNHILWCFFQIVNSGEDFRHSGAKNVLKKALAPWNVPI